MSINPHSLATLALHADDLLPGEADVAPPIHLSTTFEYPQIADDSSSPQATTGDFLYSRYHTPTRTRLETVLSALLHGPTLTYSSGVAAVHAYLVCLKPKRIALGPGYYGSRQVAHLYQELTGCEILTFDQLDSLREGDVIHLETPVNPTGEAQSIKAFAKKAHDRGAYLAVDSTFAPPGLQDPFALGADLVMHSGTKYFGGHHDLLCGTVSVRPEREGDWLRRLMDQRLVLGCVLGSMEGWLGLRSLRTLELRVKRQSENATALVGWLEELRTSETDNVVRGTVHSVSHASLQEGDMGWLMEQMPNGFGAVFALELKTEEMTRQLPAALLLFQHATSLGGVESQVEWRKLVDASAPPTLLRFSIGVENIEDLKEDLLRGLGKLLV
ncbi:cystathionine gamma-synthase [Aspergillus heteromorphus CBS 117.55]|uniref:Cystathionine gamma-synthase n=1 Tax=Aspergillus heteromorphus CBS 117.55 TaxID=1448321 RepID=A0A317WET8_9EURO|nr:cystathionine gamma-synthase [Aspergillus heteromorphus CBS 117.55]PWY84789.1 cystathionine gamma-synthase [Aspergillus heteromorphus CBS 117.55]